jgi:Protein of unknown function (DUF4231)
LKQVVHIPYTVEQSQNGIWRARSQVPSQAEANGSGRSRDEAVADLRASLASVVAELGVPDELSLTVNVARPSVEPGALSWWNLRRRWKLWCRRGRLSQQFSLDDWEPAIRSLSDDGKQRYVRLRWARSIELMDLRHRRDVRLFYILRSLSILGGVAVTALSGIGLSTKNSSAEVRWTIFALGFLVAGSAAMEQLGHYNQHRMLARGAREDLISAGFSYLLPAPDDNQFQGFRDKIERILKGYNQAYGKTISGP